MGREIRLLQSAYYEPFVAKHYISLGDVEKNHFKRYIITEWIL